MTKIMQLLFIVLASIVYPLSILGGELRFVVEDESFRVNKLFPDWLRAELSENQEATKLLDQKLAEGDLTIYLTTDAGVSGARISEDFNKIFLSTVFVYKKADSEIQSLGIPVEDVWSDSSCSSIPTLISLKDNTQLSIKERISTVPAVCLLLNFMTELGNSLNHGLKIIDSKQYWNPWNYARDVEIIEARSFKILQQAYKYGAEHCDWKFAKKLGSDAYIEEQQRFAATRTDAHFRGYILQWFLKLTTKD